MSVSQPTRAVSSKPRIGDYEILARIGQGGIAEIYKGFQLSLQREVAIKVLSPQYIHESEIVRRFEREAIVIAKLNHPNIVQIIDKGVQGGRCYFVMEFVDGADFKTMLRDPAVDLAAKLNVIVIVCQALDFAHKSGIIHRDIKPANILIDRRGNVKLADFGIAQLRGTPDAETTSADLVMGTLAYMSPEQKFCSANVTPAADIYSLGIILYEICCGRKPEGRFRAPSEINPAIPPGMDEIINRCLADSPGDRYPSADELRLAIQKVLTGEDPAADSSGITTRVESFLGKCRFLETIREDTFGAVYLVENKDTGLLYIIKKRNRDQSGLREARLLARLKHKHIANIFGAGGTQDKTVFVTEHLPGGSLGKRLGRRYLWKEAMTIAAQIAEGLSFAHKNNIVHGDLCPSNVLFDREGAVRLTDFGLPRHNGNREHWYSPPERDRTRQGDIYSLGIILYTLLAGRPPRPDRNMAAELTELEETAPPEIVAILRRMVQTRPADRYQELDEMLADFAQFERRREAHRQAVVPDGDAGRGRSKYLPMAIAAGVVVVAVAMTLIVILSR